MVYSRFYFHKNKPAGSYMGTYVVSGKQRRKAGRTQRLVESRGGVEWGDDQLCLYHSCVLSLVKISLYCAS